ncbi:MAG: copper chaperone PCu(A)C [Rickettsiaceae bacterium]|nr:copper chaperone PCu(A)C [Rickettsiaceae bacterium]
MYKNITLVLSIIALFSISATYADDAVMEKGVVDDAEEVVKESDLPKTLEIVNAWASKPLSPNNNSAIYMTINNPTKQSITIIGAATMIANNVELHQSFVDERNISRMVTLDKIVVPAEGQVTLAQGGIHIMLFDLKGSVSTGDKFDASVYIKGMQPIKFEVVVQ